MEVLLRIERKLMIDVVPLVEITHCHYQMVGSCMQSSSPYDCVNDYFPTGHSARNPNIGRAESPQCGALPPVMVWGGGAQEIQKKPEAAVDAELPGPRVSRDFCYLSALLVGFCSLIPLQTVYKYSCIILQLEYVCCFVCIIMCVFS